MDQFLFQASLYLIAIVIAVPIATRLGLGSVLGYLCAGIVIGPVLGLVGSETADLQHFAEFGVVVMLFLIGLELEPRALWEMRDKLLGLGGLQVVLTTAAIFVGALVLGAEWQVALATGMILSLSSTAIVLQTLTEKRLLQTPGGRSTFSVLLMQDIAVIPFLALMPLLALPGARALARNAEGEHIALSLIADMPGWGVTLVTIAAVVAVGFAGHYLVRPAYHYVAAARLREINTALALTIVVVIAALMQLVGLSPALGTFLAGVVLAGTEFRHELESDLSPFKGLLLGLFFITVGAGIDFGILISQPVTILALTLAVMAIKGVVLYMLSRAFGLQNRDKWLFSLSLAQAGEFSFVLLAFAVTQRIVPTALAQQLLLVVALSMLLTPLFFIFHEVIARRMKDSGNAVADEIKDPQPIIIAGVGRFGQVVNRMVTMSGFKTTILDQNLATIQLLRQFGFKGYVGDPTRPELLQAAGLGLAKVLVVCLDDRAATNRLVSYARRQRPDLHIIARARDREHVFELYRAGANDIVREYFDSSLRAARYVLENVGLTEYEATELQKLFFRLDREAVRDLAEVWKPGVPAQQNPDYMARTKEINRELEAALIARFSESAPESDPDNASEGDPGKPS